MLKQVTTPRKKQITFEYEALGRRTAKIVTRHPELVSGSHNKDQITRFVWDGNIPLHEWTYNLEDRPKQYVDATDEIASDGNEPIDTTKLLGFLKLVALYLPQN